MNAIISEFTVHYTGDDYASGWTDHIFIINQ